MGLTTTSIVPLSQAKKSPATLRLRAGLVHGGRRRGFLAISRQTCSYRGGERGAAPLPCPWCRTRVHAVAGLSEIARGADAVSVTAGTPYSSRMPDDFKLRGAAVHQ